MKIFELQNKKYYLKGYKCNFIGFSNLTIKYSILKNFKL